METSRSENPYRSNSRPVGLAVVGVILLAATPYLARLQNAPPWPDWTLPMLSPLIGGGVILIYSAYWAYSRRKLAEVVDLLLHAPGGCLARWTYSPGTWAAFQRGERARLWRKAVPVLGFFAVCSVVWAWAVMHYDLSRYNLFAIGGCWLLIAVVVCGQLALLSGGARQPRVVIGRDGALVNRAFRSWKQLFDVDLKASVKDEGTPVLLVEWVTMRPRVGSRLGGWDPVPRELRVPIPDGGREEAEQVARTLGG